MKRKTGKKQKNPFSVTKPLIGGARFVGVYMPLEYADFVMMGALFENTTASAILREAVKHFVESRDFDRDYLENVLANRARQEWEKRLRENKGTKGWDVPAKILERYREFEQEMKFHLMDRGLSEKAANAIIQQMETLYGLGGNNIQ